MSKKQPAHMFIQNFEELSERKFFVYSDTHYSHANIVRETSNWDDKSRCRDFDTLEEHNKAIVNGINENVGSEDVLIHLGDWSFGGKDKVVEFRNKIACKNIILLYGNHDHNIQSNRDFQKLFSWCGYYLELKYQGKNYVMSHYPFGSWNGVGKGWINLFGHCHGNYTTRGRQIDICPENNNYKPYSLEELGNRMSKVETVLVDHHDKNSNTY